MRKANDVQKGTAGRIVWRYLYVWHFHCILRRPILIMTGEAPWLRKNWNVYPQQGLQRKLKKRYLPKHGKK